MRSLEDIECFDCPYDEYKSIFNWLVMTKGRAWVNALYEEQLLYALYSSETETQQILEERAYYFDKPPYDWFLIIKPIEGEGNVGQLFVAVAMVVVSATAAFFTAGASLGVSLAIMAAALTVNAGLSYLSYKLAPHANMAQDPIAGAELNSNLFGQTQFTLEQGGVVPLIYGYTYARGTLISSSITTTQG